MWRFHLGNEIPMGCLFIRRKWIFIYIYMILNLEDEVYSIWVLWTSSLQQYKGNFFLKVDVRDTIFWIWWVHDLAKQAEVMRLGMMSSSPSPDEAIRVAHINHVYANFLPTVIALVSEGVGKSRTHGRGERPVIKGLTTGWTGTHLLCSLLHRHSYACLCNNCSAPSCTQPNLNLARFVNFLLLLLLMEHFIS